MSQNILHDIPTQSTKFCKDYMTNQHISTELVMRCPPTTCTGFSSGKHYILFRLTLYLYKISPWVTLTESKCRYCITLSSAGHPRVIHIIQGRSRSNPNLLRVRARQYQSRAPITGRTRVRSAQVVCLLILFILNSFFIVFRDIA